jgi:hypothetical protein
LIDRAADDDPPIEGRQLTTWAVMPGGADVRPDLSTADGKTRSVVLPFDALSSLLMTLPRMLQAALDARRSDESLCVAQLLGKWRLEQAKGDTGLILKLSTTDGFDVAFALNNAVAGSLGTALVATSGTAGALAKTQLH